MGAMLCRRLAAPGRVLFVHTGTRRSNAEAVCRELEQKGATAHPLVANFVQDPSAGATLIEEIKRRCGRLDQLVHMAGFVDLRQIGVLTGSDFDASLSGILRSFFHLMTAALPLLRASPAGRVVTTGSFIAHAFRFEKTFVLPASAAARGGVAAMTKSLAAQLAPDRITVNCVVPGLIRKQTGAHIVLDEEQERQVPKLIPLGRRGEPDEVTATIAFLLSAEGGYITGQCIHVDGGLSL
jgi:NAD(P)-dependent dehydrogenase (short-subunit alcohol dehydrogenase family)